MTKSLPRSLRAVFMGAIVAAVLIMAVEALSGWLFPLPPRVDPHDRQALAAHLATLPWTALALVLLAWALGTFAGAYVAGRLARRAPIAHGLVVGVLFLAAGVANMLMLPHPIWMWIGGVAGFLAGGYGGGRLAARKAAALQSSAA